MNIIDNTIDRSIQNKCIKSHIYIMEWVVVAYIYIYSKKAPSTSSTQEKRWHPFSCQILAPIITHE